LQAKPQHCRPPTFKISAIGSPIATTLPLQQTAANECARGEDFKDAAEARLNIDEFEPSTGPWGPNAVYKLGDRVTIRGERNVFVLRCEKAGRGGVAATKIAINYYPSL